MSDEPEIFFRPSKGFSTEVAAFRMQLMNGELRRRPTSAAKRMRDYRERRREGWRCVRLTIHEGNVKALLERGYLDPQSCEDREAIEIAIDNFINREL